MNNSILLKSVSLKNFLSHSSTTLEFKPDDRINLSGKSGAGKSAITESIVWCLFNTGRVQNRSLIKRGTSSMSVAVELVDGEDTYKIVRSLSIPKKNANVVHEIKIYKNGKVVEVNGTRNIQDYVEKQIIKCNFALFVNSVVYLQENLESFARSTPAVRKDILLSLVHADSYDTYYDLARQAINSLDTKLTINLTRKEALLGEISRSKPLIDNLPSYEKDFNYAQDEITDIEGKLSVIQELEVKSAQLNAQTEGVRTRSMDIQQNIWKITKLKTEAGKLVEELKSINPEEIKAKFEEAQNLRRELTELETLAEQRRLWQTAYAELANKRPYIKDYSVLIRETEKEFQQVVSNSTVITEQCPNCGQEHACAHQKSEVERQTKRLSELLASYEEKQTTENGVLDKYTLEMQTLKEQEVKMDEHKIGVIKLQLAKLEPYIEKFYSAQNRDALLVQQEQLVAQYDKTLEQYNSDYSQLRSQVEELERQAKTYIGLYEQKLGFIKQQQEIQIRFGQLSESLALARAAVARKETIEKELEGFATEDAGWKTRMENMNLLKEALGGNGIRTLVLDYLLPSLEEKINSVLATLSGFRIQLDTLTDSVSGDKKIEGLHIHVINEQGESFEYGSYSGGEKVKITFAIAEGLAKFSSLGFRILDEAVIGLDSSTGQMFADAILAFQNFYSQLICISHISEIKEIFEHKVEIVNINGDSKIAT